jgi:uncharacterized membrane protein YdjX (TVP38/TMEM64 family)
MRVLRVIIICVILMLFGAFFTFLFQEDPQSIILEILENNNNGILWIILTIFAFTLLSTLTGLPVLYLSIALGFFLNYLPAIFLSWLFSLIAVMLTFFMVRKVFSSYFLERYGNRKIIMTINMRIEKYNFWTVAMSRGVYVIPTNIVNFSFPLSKITSKHYFIGTMIGLVPEIFINVTTGYLIKHQILLLESPQQNMLKISVIGVFLLLMAIGILIVNYRRKKVKKARMNEFLPPLQDS